MVRYNPEDFAHGSRHVLIVYSVDALRCDEGYEATCGVLSASTHACLERQEGIFDDVKTSEGVVLPLCVFVCGLHYGYACQYGASKN